MASCIVKHQLLTERAHAKIFLATEVDCPGRLVIKSAEADRAESLEKEKDVYDDLGRDCPNVVTCYGYYRSYEEADDEEIYNLVMEYATEGSMEGLMEDGKLIVNGSGPMDVVDQIRAYSKMILKGLEHIHENGYVHCNLNPTTVLAFLPDMDEDIETRYCYRLKISDFKLCKRAGETYTIGGLRRTYWSRFTVNPRYMSPESVLFEEYEPPMDIWALGCIVNEMVSACMTGGLPVREHVKVAARRVLLGVAPEIHKDVCFWGGNFLSRCFEVRPECRWTAKMLLEHPFITGGFGRFGYMMYTGIAVLKAEEEEEEDDSWVHTFFDFLDADTDKEDTDVDTGDDHDNDVADDESWVPVCDVYGVSDLDDEEYTDDDEDTNGEDADDEASSGSTSASSSTADVDADASLLDWCKDAGLLYTCVSLRFDITYHILHFLLSKITYDSSSSDDGASTGSTSASISTDDEASSGSTGASSSTADVDVDVDAIRLDRFTHHMIHSLLSKNTNDSSSSTMMTQARGVECLQQQTCRWCKLYPRSMKVQFHDSD